MLTDTLAALAIVAASFAYAALYEVRRRIGWWD